MAEIPTPREFARMLRRMELPERARLSDLARKGRRAKDPEEAALVAAAARRELRGQWAYVGLALLIGSNVVIGFSTRDRIGQWLGVASIAVILFALIPLTLVRRRRLLEAERLNRKLAGERP